MTQTQNVKILAWLKKGRTLTSLEAVKKFDCLNLKGRIYEIKNDWKLRREYKGVVLKKFIRVPSGKTVAQYRLETAR